MEHMEFDRTTERTESSARAWVPGRGCANRKRSYVLTADRRESGRKGDRS